MQQSRPSPQCCSWVPGWRVNLCLCLSVDGAKSKVITLAAAAIATEKKLILIKYIILEKLNSDIPHWRIPPHPYWASGQKSLHLLLSSCRICLNREAELNLNRKPQCPIHTCRCRRRIPAFFTTMLKNYRLTFYQYNNLIHF